MSSGTSRQDSIAAPGNFGGGSAGPDQIFLGITRAPPSAPGRGRAQSPVRRNPNPPDHRAREADESGSHSRSFSNPQIGEMPWFPQAIPMRGGQRLIWFRLDVLRQPAVLGKRLEVSQTGYNQVSPKICSRPARSSHQVLHDRHMEIIYFLDAQEAKWSKRH